MNAIKPYLIRAFYEWINDNDCTPYLLVNAVGKDVLVPQQFVKNGEIILNVAPRAVEGMMMGNELIEFRARFGGVSIQISVPTASVKAIYAQENGRGMVFEETEGDGPPPAGDEPSTQSPPRSRPQLKVVK
jgi:stringent starvation protein B